MSTRSERTNFVLLFEGRSGSTFAIETLDSHPEVQALPEPPKGVRKKRGSAQTFLDYARSVYASTPSECRAAGFKVKLHDVPAPDAFAEFLCELDVAVVVLQRRNVVKWTVSHLNAIRLREATGDWNLYREEDRLPPFAPSVEEFEVALRAGEEKQRRLREYAADLARPALWLHYEDILTDPPTAFRRLFSFLGVTYGGNSGRARKNTSDDLRQALANYDQLRDRYRGTRYEQMFDDVSVSVR